MKRTIAHVPAEMPHSVPSVVRERQRERRLSSILSEAAHIVSSLAHRVLLEVERRTLNHSGVEV